MMASAETVTLVWHYSPTDFFEAPVDESEDKYKLRIEQGKIEAVLDASAYDASRNMSETIIEEIRWRFFAARLSKRREFTIIGNSSMTRLAASGRQEVSINIGLNLNAMVPSIRPETMATDAAGRVTHDSKKARLDNEKAFEATIHQLYGDSTLESLLSSHGRAIHNPSTVLVHLFEILDVFKRKFHHWECVCSKLNFPTEKHTRLWALANNEPLNQGRHAGTKDPADLRDATPQEVSEAWDIAEALIKAYVAFASTESTGRNT